MWICQQCGHENTHNRVVCSNCDGIRVNEIRDVEYSEGLEEIFLEAWESSE